MQGDWILLQNEISGVGRIIDLAWEKGLRVIFNPSPMSDEVLQYDLSKVSMFLMNEDEGKRITGRNATPEILQEMEKRYPDCQVILTLGSDGAIWSDGRKRVHQAACCVEAVDTTGAGDTFTGYVLASLAQGASIEDSLALATRASAIMVTRQGAAQSIPYRTEVEANE